MSDRARVSSTHAESACGDLTDADAVDAAVARTSRDAGSAR